VRVASDYRRSRRRRPEVSDAGVEEPFDEAPGAEELLDMRAARETLDEVLDRMSLELRAVFVLFELEQMTVTEIAALLSVPRGTVASRLRRAKSFFRESVARSANANTSEDGDE
jgi:RNA polymerase sigma-70 factor (ECF subfamily)